MKYEVIESKLMEGSWTVSAVDHESECECYFTVFSGHRAKERAVEYATWKTVHEHVNGRDHLAEMLQALERLEETIARGLTEVRAFADDEISKKPPDPVVGVRSPMRTERSKMERTDA